MTLDLAHRLAAATAVHDPSLMLELRVADAGTEPPHDGGREVRRRSSAPSCAPGSTKA